MNYFLLPSQKSQSRDEWTMCLTEPDEYNAGKTYMFYASKLYDACPSVYTSPYLQIAKQIAMCEDDVKFCEITNTFMLNTNNAERISLSRTPTHAEVAEVIAAIDKSCAVHIVLYIYNLSAPFVDILIYAMTGRFSRTHIVKPSIDFLPATIDHNEVFVVCKWRNNNHPVQSSHVVAPHPLPKIFTNKMRELVSVYGKQQLQFMVRTVRSASETEYTTKQIDKWIHRYMSRAS